MLFVSISTFYYCYMNTINRPCNRRIDEIELGYFQHTEITDKQLPDWSTLALLALLAYETEQVLIACVGRF